MSSSWISQARAQLIRLRGPAPGWSYRPAGDVYVEPTVLAALALRASEPESGDSGQTAQLCRSAADWVAGAQEPDGAVGISQQLGVPRWPTSYAVLLWMVEGGFQPRVDKAIEWLTGIAGKTSAARDDDFGLHDTTIPGWPWVQNTHSWVEPTVLAVLAMRRSGHADDKRTIDGLRLLRDRAIETGGWNYGNPHLFGSTLRARPAPTGLALMALAGVDEYTPIIERGCDYLAEELTHVRAPQSLSWGLLGMTAWGRRPADADAWLTEAFAGVAKHSNPTLQLAYLLLAAHTKSLTLLGLPDHAPAPQPAGKPS
ncbi:MAG: hypothetical protein GC159_04090 [Phycisphaera sp.]|nr:hypothetical protein [Phycisphaera sp.]